MAEIDPIDFKIKAQMCRKKADSIKNPELKAQWLGVAAEWENLADLHRQDEFTRDWIDRTKKDLEGSQPPKRDAS